MRLTITTNVSVDGVMQGLGGADEDRRGGFDRGGWAIPLLDNEVEDHNKEVYGGAAAFLFGRRTYEIFAGSWGAIPEMRTSPIGAAGLAPTMARTTVGCWRVKARYDPDNFFRFHQSFPSLAPRGGRDRAQAVTEGR